LQIRFQKVVSELFCNYPLTQKSTKNECKTLKSSDAEYKNVFFQLKFFLYKDLVSQGKFPFEYPNGINLFHRFCIFCQSSHDSLMNALKVKMILKSDDVTNSLKLKNLDLSLYYSLRLILNKTWYLYHLKLKKTLLICKRSRYLFVILDKKFIFFINFFYIFYKGLKWRHLGITVLWWDLISCWNSVIFLWYICIVKVTLHTYKVKKIK